MESLLDSDSLGPRVVGITICPQGKNPHPSPKRRLFWQIPGILLMSRNHMISPTSLRAQSRC